MTKRELIDALEALDVPDDREVVLRRLGEIFYEPAYNEPNIELAGSYDGRRALEIEAIILSPGECRDYGKAATR